MADGRRLILLRHGRTAWNDARRAQGHTDVPLDDEGRAQAAAAATYFAAVPLEAVWSSDLVRASETAEMIARACGLGVKTDARLREYDVGEMQGLTTAEAALRWPHLRPGRDLDDPLSGIPGAETHEDVARRIVPACREALTSLQPGETGLVVTHGAALKAALAGLLGWPRSVTGTLRTVGNCDQVVLEELGHEGPLRLIGYGIPPISRT